MSQPETCQPACACDGETSLEIHTPTDCYDRRDRYAAAIRDAVDPAAALDARWRVAGEAAGAVADAEMKDLMASCIQLSEDLREARATTAAVPPPAREEQSATDEQHEVTRVTADPDGGFILHLPEITYFDTQVWSVDIGLTEEALTALRAALTPNTPARNERAAAGQHEPAPVEGEQDLTAQITQAINAAGREVDMNAVRAVLPVVRAAGTAAARRALEDSAPLAPMFEGLHSLLATSSRDWGEYRVDAWLYAVLVGWDCEDDHDHTDDCFGAMEEQQERHGWSDEAVAKARRYRASVRAATAAVAPPAREDDAATAEPELTATLIIGGSNSRCGHCGKSVLPQDTRHVDISGWTPQPGAGCGARFVGMRSDSWGVTPDDLKKVRPDLPVDTTPTPAEGQR